MPHGINTLVKVDLDPDIKHFRLNVLTCTVLNRLWQEFGNRIVCMKRRVVYLGLSFVGNEKLNLEAYLSFAR